MMLLDYVLTSLPLGYEFAGSNGRRCGEGVSARRMYSACDPAISIATLSIDHFVVQYAMLTSCESPIWQLVKRAATVGKRWKRMHIKTAVWALGVCMKTCQR
jgi:hypothetical protein